MTTELCARPGCGAPRAWHDPLTVITFEALIGGEPWTRNFRHMAIDSRPWVLAPGHCIGSACSCPGYLAPEPPRPDRKPYVVEMDDEVSDFYRTYPGAYSDTSATQICHDAVPLDEYLASHPQQPSRPPCICGGEFDEHGEDGRCSHMARNWRQRGTIPGYVKEEPCECAEYRPVEASS